MYNDLHSITLGESYHRVLLTVQQLHDSADQVGGYQLPNSVYNIKRLTKKD